MKKFVSAELPVFHFGKCNLVLASCLLFTSQMGLAAQTENIPETGATLINSATHQNVTNHEDRLYPIADNLPLGIKNNAADFDPSIPEVSLDWTIEHIDTTALSTSTQQPVKTMSSDLQEDPRNESDLKQDKEVVSTKAPNKSSINGEEEDNQKTDSIAVSQNLEEVSSDWVSKVISRTGGETLLPESPLPDGTTGESVPSTASENNEVEVLAETPATIIQVASPPVEIEPIDPDKLGDIRELPHHLIVNTERYPDLRAYESAQSDLLLQLAPIATILGDSFSFDESANSVKYVRSRDGARFELNTETGEVLANGTSVGYLNEVGLIDADTGLFPANAVQVFAGLHIESDDDEQLITLTLDERLQYVSGFELFVNGQLLPAPDPEPRALGHVLLLPLRPIADELGSRVEVAPDNNQVSVIRYQDNATITLNLTTGLIEVEGTPVGTAPNMAFADRTQLLLPKESVASLTGTYITIPPGSRRIDVDLDGQLARIIHPGDSIQNRAASSPPSVESVKAFYDSDNRASAVVRGHYSSYNLKFEYETPTTKGDDGFTAQWMQLYAESIEGWGLGLGDHVTQRRELTGVNTSRIKGAYFYNPLNDGVLVGTLGKAQNGSRLLDGGDSVPTFGGDVGGIRYYANDGKFELGVAAKNDESADDRSIVASSFKVFEQPEFRLGDLYQRAEFAMGAYESDDDTNLGGRFAWEGRLQPSKQLSLFARSDYSSSHLVGEVEAQDLEDDSLDVLEADRLSYGVGGSFRPHQRLAYGLNHSRMQRGFIEGDDHEAIDIWQESTTANVSLKPFVTHFSPWTYFSWHRTTASDNESVRRLSGQAVWRYEKVSFLIKHEDQRGEESGRSWLSSMQISRDAWIRYFALNSSISLSPRFNAWKNSESLKANLGALLSFDSGELLGRRTNLRMAYGRNLGVQVLDSDNAEVEDETFTDGNDYFSANLDYRFNRLVRFTSNYYSDLDGNDSAYAALTAYYEFNPPRNIKMSRENAGLLTGQVFLDENHDGIQQENEKGIPGARVSIKGTRLGLNADPNGRFTIQNLPVGVYRVVPDTTQMPLGYMGDPDKIPPVRIGDSLITEMSIPVVKGSQLKGVVYIDRNRNGILDIEDERLENVGLELADGRETASTVFGQFTFDFLPADKYRVSVQEETLPDGVHVAREQKLIADLSNEDDNKLNIRLIDSNY